MDWEVYGMSLFIFLLLPILLSQCHASSELRCGQKLKLFFPPQVFGKLQRQLQILDSTVKGWQKVRRVLR